LKLRFLFLAIIPFLAGCAGYRPHSLRRLTPKPVPQHEKILFEAKAFNHCDCNTYLDRNVICAGYTPIQIAIKNESNQYIEFTTDKVNLNTVPTSLVAESVYQSVLARALGYGIPGLFIWPFLVPAVLDSIWASEANEMLLRDYLGKTISDKTLVPDSELEGLIFVANSQYQNKLEVTLVDRDSLEKIVCKTYL
jgi:hypothetical protein